MKMKIDEHKINIYKSLFRGRDDIYAERWENESRSGYMPAYKVDWSEWENHKTQGGTFQDYKKKKLKPFDINAIESHITGEKTCGIYPLMKDNTSYFLAVDFDKENWEESILKLYRTCEKFSIKSYIERSRSGNGGNLISLPLNGKSMEHGNTCFLNPDSFVAFEDQWAFLESIKKIPTANGFKEFRIS